jgi:hypothetical protein
MLTSPEPGHKQRATMPVEQVAVTFFDLPCLTVRDADGSIYLSIGDMCAAIGVNRSSQMRRVRNHRQLVKGLKLFRVRTAGGLQTATQAGPTPDDRHRAGPLIGSISGRFRGGSSSDRADCARRGAMPAGDTLP